MKKLFIFGFYYFFIYCFSEKDIININKIAKFFIFIYESDIRHDSDVDNDYIVDNPDIWDVGFIDNYDVDVYDFNSGNLSI